jgi:fatty-acyl-CoA synthase
MSLGARLRREWRYLGGLLRTLRRIRSIDARSANLVCDDLEAAMDRWPARQAITFEGAALTYAGLEALANRYAHWAVAQGLGRGEAVAIFLPNRLDYLAIWFGLAKVGVVGALINNQLAGQPLAHCLNISGARHCLVDEETAPVLAAARGFLAPGVAEWSLAETGGEQHDLAATIAALPATRPDRAVRAGMTARDTALFIYTSGSTGLPKAAGITHMRAQLYLRAFAGSTGSRADDRVYVTLPLYHATGGLCATGAALLNGACVILRRRFSASRFWPEIAAEGATMFVYIGELCRYLIDQAPPPGEPPHKLRLAFGNGLRPDVWRILEERFAVPRVLEFYGSTEGNVSMFNFDGKQGAIGRVPAWLASQFNIALVRFDIDTETPARGPDGFCLRAPLGEAGECLGKIGGDARGAYTGYVDRAASEKAVLRDVFRKGDRWFRTGDLLRQDKDGYFYFVDRVGDTYRWKGENVSTGEVMERILEAPGVRQANVYGVTVGALEGRAGMAALVVGEDFDLAAFNAHVQAALPPYARPLFIRLLSHLETTGTFKPRKVDLVAQGFDPAKVPADLYFRAPDQAFTPMTPELYGRIVGGEVRV